MTDTPVVRFAEIIDPDDPEVQFIRRCQGTESYWLDPASLLLLSRVVSLNPTYRRVAQALAWLALTREQGGRVWVGPDAKAPPDLPLLPNITVHGV